MARSPASVNNTSSTYIPVTPSSRRNTVVMRRALASHAAIEVAGSHLDGVSVADTLASGVAAAERLLERG